MVFATDAWIWIEALVTLAIFSYLYRDNPIYKLAEYLFVGVAAGYYVAIQFRNVLQPNLINPLLEGPQGFGYVLYIIPLILALMMLTRLVPQMAWLSRWPIGMMVGSFAGLAIIGNAQGDFISQVQANLLPIIDSTAVTAFSNATGLTNKFIAFLWLFGNAMLIFGLLSTLVFFFFSTEHRGAVGATAKVGIYFLMLSFGASFGFTVMARISLLLERLTFLYGDWLGLSILR